MAVKTANVLAHKSIPFSLSLPTAPTALDEWTPPHLTQLCRMDWTKQRLTVSVLLLRCLQI